MKVEILETLKGSTTWRKGTVFDDTVSPIPGDILKEVDSGSRTVKVMAENPFAVTETKNEIQESVGEVMDVWGKLPDIEYPLQEKTATPQPEKVENEAFVCTICKWSGKTEAALKRHITMVHR